MTSIRYFIPEDGDMETQPNVFLAPKSRQHGTPPTLGQVKQAFPLPGRYHFRFKTSLGGDTKLAVWMDCTDDRQPVHVWKNHIIAKVTRLGVEEDDDDDDDDDDEDFRRPPPQQQQQSSVPSQQPRAPPPPPQQQKQQSFPQQTAAPPKPASVETPSFDIFDAPHHHSSSAAAGASPNLLDGHHHHHGGGSSSTNANLLDMSFSGSATPSATTSSAPSHHDFLGMTATPTPPVSGNYNNMFGAQQQQQQQQRPPTQSQTSFNSFGSTNKINDGPFGGLGTPWK